MKKIITLTLVAIFAYLVPCTPALADNPKALFLYWRGPTECKNGFISGLEKLGIKPDITEFNAERDKTKLVEYLKTVDDQSYNFVYTFGTTVSLAAAEHFKATPVAFAIVSAPVESGLIKSWEAPGANVTGISQNIPTSEVVQFIGNIGKFQKSAISPARMKRIPRCFWMI